MTLFGFVVITLAVLGFVWLVITIIRFIIDFIEKRQAEAERLWQIHVEVSHTNHMFEVLAKSLSRVNEKVNSANEALEVIGHELERLKGPFL